MLHGVDDCTTVFLQTYLKIVVQFWIPYRCALLKLHIIALTTHSVLMERNAAYVEIVPRDAIHWPRQENARKLTLNPALQFYDLLNVLQTGTVLESKSVVLTDEKKNAHPLSYHLWKVWCGLTYCKFKLLGTLAYTKIVSKERQIHLVHLVSRISSNSLKVKLWLSTLAAGTFYQTKLSV